MIEFEPGEKLIREVHRHWFVMVGPGFAVIVAALIPLLFLIATGVITELTADTIRYAAPAAIFLYSIWLLMLWIFFFIEWTDYYLDLWYVTDRRIIDINQKGFFRREVISFHFDNVQNITLDTEGLIQTFLKFGDIHVQTAGTNEKMILRNAASALDIKNLILDMQEKSRNEPKKVEIVKDDTEKPAG